MNILVFGAHGWIGQQFIDHLKTQSDISYTIAESRANDVLGITKEMSAPNLTHVVAFIGRTHGPGYNTIDYLEQPGKLYENVRDNLFSPLVLAKIADKFNLHYTYLGTGCIFSQDDPLSKSYTEEDLPDFYGSSYSVVKGFTDQLMHLFPRTLNLRIRMPIVAHMHPRNFITKIVQYEKVCSIANSMTVLPDMYPIILDMMINNTTGTINLTNPGVITHNEILEMFRDIVDPNFKWNNFTIDEQNQILASKRSNNQLDTTRLQSLYPNIPHIKHSIKKCLQAMRSKDL